MKISIKVSILSLFAAILVIIGSTLIALNYTTSHTVLMKSAKDSVKLTNTIIVQSVKNFLLPIENRIKVCSNAIKKKMIKPDGSTEFYTFLLQNLSDLPNFYTVYWADAAGNAYFVERAKNNFNTVKAIQTKKGRVLITQNVDQNGIALAKNNSANTTYDPRQRPWYQDAIKEKMCVLTAPYLFYNFTGGNAVLGLSYACPVYDDLNKLLGVFAFDLRVSDFSKFVSALHITENANILVIDNYGYTIATNFFGNYEKKEIKVPEDLKVGWLGDAYNKYNLERGRVYSFPYYGISILGLYDEFSPIVHSPNRWSVAILLPSLDILADLNIKVLISIGIATAILILGLLLAWVAAQALSKPIVQLTNEAGLIKKMDINFVSTLKSNIKEIIYMQDAFASMKKSLQSFARYVPLTLIKRLVDSGDIAKVGGESRRITFLFSDIFGFTSISEHMDPQQLMNYLSEYFEAMTKIVLQNQGTVDKYIGDAIMAFWNAPLDDINHARHACKSALEMQDILESLNQNWHKQGKPELKIRIGINTGNAVIGNVGSEDRLSYTALGDSVNLSERIEELCKLYQAKIVVSASTYQLVKTLFTFRFLDAVSVRGRNEGVFVYELLPPVNPFGSRLEEYNQNFAKGFSLYHQEQWDDAIAIFAKLAEEFPFDKVAQLFIERCKQLKDHPVPDWNGVWRYM